MKRNRDSLHTVCCRGIHIWKTFVLLALLTNLVLRCSQQHDDGKALADFSDVQIAAPPEWAVKGIVYEIYLRAFTDAGTIAAATERLPDVRDLGANIIWLMPIYPIGAEGRKGSLGSPYAVTDFRKVNPELGNLEDLRKFVKTAHHLGLKVILDMVPHHGANDHRMTKVHPDWFKQDSAGNFIRREPEWSDIIDFNYQNQDLRNHMIGNFAFWLRETDIDGFRCDVAGRVPDDFWKDCIAQLKQIKPDIWMLAEWEKPELLIAGFHSDYDWTLQHLLEAIRSGKPRGGTGILAALKGKSGKYRTSDVLQMIETKESSYPQNALPLRFLENHDLPRSIKTYGTPAIDCYSTFIFMLPGVPLIYAGQETGDTLRPSLFEKETIAWEKTDQSLRNRLRQLCHFRKNSDAATRGKFEIVQTSMLDGAAATFLRTTGQEVLLVIVNLRNDTAKNVYVTPSAVQLSAHQGKTFNRLFSGGDGLVFGNIYREQLLPFSIKIYQWQSSVH